MTDERQSLSRRAVRRASLIVDRISPPAAGVSILIYHRVGGGTTSAVDLDLDEFRRQLDHLDQLRRVITLDEAVRGLSREDGSVDGSVVLTFDDGTADFVDTVVPELIEHHLPATVYIATQFIDEQLDFPWGASPASWNGLRDAVSTGLVGVGSHTHRHLLLDRGSIDDATNDVARSIDLIASQLGAPPMHFAYPKALAGGSAVHDMISARFRSAVLAGGRVNPVGNTDLHRLRRTPIQRGDPIDVFEHKVRCGLRLEGSIRSVTARFRARGATQ